MGDHYIPRHYLKGFCSPGKDLLWVYQIGRGQPFQVNVLKVANEKGYYSTEVEQYLADEIESPTALLSIK